MRAMRNALVVCLAALFSVTAQETPSASCDIAQATKCASSCQVSGGFPSCDELCRSSCRKYTSEAIDPNNSCGGSFGCGINETQITKTCRCGGSSCAETSVPCSTDSECCDNHCSMVQGTCNDDTTPILISLQNGGDLMLTNPEDGVWFDMFADGRSVRIAWTTANTEVGFLALDRNSNGLVDDGSELFGNYTPLSSGGNAANGFEALVDLDGGADVSDGALTSTDPGFSQLRLWIDRNHDAYSQPEELLEMQEAGIVKIFTAYQPRRRVDDNFNRYILRGEAVISRNGRERELRIWDVILRRAFSS